MSKGYSVSVPVEYGHRQVLTGAEMLFEIVSQRYERSSTPVTSNLPFAEWMEVGSEQQAEAIDR